MMIHAPNMKPPPSPTDLSSSTSRSSILKASMTDLTSPHRISRGPRPASSPLGPRTRAASRGLSLSPFSDTSSTRDSLLSLTAESVPAYPGSPLSDSPPRSFAGLPPIVESVSTESPPLKPSLIVPPPVIRIIPKPATLVPAPQISFDPVPVDFKNLTLDAFLWTLDNKDLQQMVSRAIRQSARESSIRLVSLDHLDNAIPAEIERLNALKSSTQSKYRFLVQRRTMLLQAINSSAVASEPMVQDDGTSILCQLAQQLSEACAECDKHLETLLRVTDQLGQLAKLTDIHWASALTIALRKLNKSYGKRTTDLITAREKVEQLEGELEEAWKEAARYAKEMDQVEAAGVDSDSDSGSEDEEIDDEGTAVIGHVEVVTIPPLRRASTIPDLFLRSQRSQPQIDFLPTLAPLSPLHSFSPGATQTLPTDVSPTPSAGATPPRGNPSETASIRSIRSVRSTRSLRSIKSKHKATTSDITRTSLVCAARTRSQRASKSSLRLPTKPRASHYPPVPDLPLDFTFPPLPPRPSYPRRPLTSPSPSSTRHAGWRASSFTASQSVNVGPLPGTRLARTSSSAGTSSSKASGPLLSTMDDIYLRPHLARRSEDGKQLPAPPLPAAPSSKIPAMWLASDEVVQKFVEPEPDHDSLPPTPSPTSPTPPPPSPPPRDAEVKVDPSAPIQAAPADTTYGKLKKGLRSKRYTMPFPLLKSASFSGRSLPEKKKTGSEP